MQLAAPPVTRFDVRFSIFNIPVRIHPLFWAIGGILGLLNSRAAGNNPLISMSLWMGAIFISILVHELGHALVAKKWGWDPSITLYGFGGVASYNPNMASPNRRMWIAFAGPLAGFVLGGLVIGGVLAWGHSVALPGLPIAIGSGPPLSIAGGRFEEFIFCMLLVNIFWGLINLAPIQPLDGGSIAAAFLAKTKPARSFELSLKVSIASAVILAVVFLALYRSIFLAVMFGWMGYSNWQMFEQLRGRSR